MGAVELFLVIKHITPYGTIVGVLDLALSLTPALLTLNSTPEFKWNVICSC